MNRLITYHPLVEEAHQQGVDFASKKEYGTAQHALTGALTLAEMTYGTDILSKIAHQGRIRRDMGLVCIRQAVHVVTNPNPKREAEAVVYFQTAENELKASRSLLLYDALTTYADQLEEGSGDVRHLNSEIGSTLTAQGRLHIAQGVCEQNPEESTRLISLGFAYLAQKAVPLLQREGDNLYYEVGGIMHAARACRLMDERKAAANLCYKASTILLGGLMDRLPDRPAARRTFARLGRDIIRGPAAIREAILAGGI